MILTKEQVEKRVSSDSNIANPSALIHSQVEVIYKDGINNKVGKGFGTKNLTPDERIAISVVASVTDSRTAADLFGIHPSHANDLKNGNRNVGNGESGSSLRLKDTSLIDQVKERLATTKLTIQERAAEKLLSAFGLFDDPNMKDKLANSSPKDVAQIANQMSQVMRNLSGKESDGNSGSGQKVQIIVHQPKQSNESSFDIIEVGVR